MNSSVVGYDRNRCSVLALISQFPQFSRHLPQSFKLLFFGPLDSRSVGKSGQVLESYEPRKTTVDAYMQDLSTIFFSKFEEL